MPNWLKYGLIGLVCVIIAGLSIYTINKNGVPTFGNWQDCDKICLADNAMWNGEIDDKNQCVCIPEFTVEE